MKLAYQAKVQNVYNIFCWIVSYYLNKYRQSDISIKKWHDELMKRLDDLRALLNSFFKKEEPEERKMKRVFQWRRYLEWKNLTPEEKLSAKRLLLIPLFAYLIIEIFNQNFSFIVLFLIGYVIYKKFERGNIVNKWI